MPGEVLNRRALNRATLHRQHLLHRHSGDALGLIEHLVGLQAQAPFPPYFGLWTRLDGFRPEDLAQLILDRAVVRIVLMRGTVHLVSAADSRALRPLVQPALDRQLRANALVTRAVDGLDLDAVADLASSLMAERPLSNGELGPLLAQRWPDRDPAALTLAMRVRLPLVQVPPRAIWGHSGHPRHTTLDAWLGQPVDSRLSIDDLVVRYLAAFGPASVRDMQTWSGLTRLREITDRLGDRLQEFRDENGAELLDLPDAPRPGPAVPAPPRFLPEFDNLLLSHAERSRMMTDQDRKRLHTPNGVFPATFLVDGVLRGTWKLTRAGASATLHIAPWRRLSTTDTSALTDEAERLLGFAAADAERSDIRVAAPN